MYFYIISAPAEPSARLEKVKLRPVKSIEVLTGKRLNVVFYIVANKDAMHPCFGCLAVQLAQVGEGIKGCRRSRSYC
ncbi:hypothetical protein [Hymenobacter arizonensis]|uniref:hypothetical protein n=1 Tax=Hymenobacter arizonensis TaxID=1227077 RepID=UPI001F1DA46F|nr:hypothetical protein [Hymenobacter arizonensis]